MKKSLFALAALTAVAGVAQAQSSVTLYGTLDQGVASVSNNAKGLNSVGMQGSLMESSQWGLKGSEDLGSGMKATFKLESQINSPDGTMHTANTLFDRASWVGLESSTLGSLHGGRELSPYIATALQYPNPGFSYSVSQLAGAGSILNGFFTPNAITYSSPAIGPVNVSLQYAPGQVAGDTTASTYWAAAATADVGGGVSLNTAYHVMGASTGATASGSSSSLGGQPNQNSAFVVGANYTAGKFAVGGNFTQTVRGALTAYNNGSLTGSTNTAGTATAQTTISTWNLGASYDVAPKVRLFANYSQSTTDNSLFGTSSIMSAAARYTLSPRTYLTAFVNHVNDAAPTSFGGFTALWGDGLGHGDVGGAVGSSTAAASGNTQSATVVGLGVTTHF